MNNSAKIFCISAIAFFGFMIFIVALGKFANENKERKAVEAAKTAEQERGMAILAQMEANWEANKKEFELSKSAILAEIAQQGIDSSYINSFNISTENTFFLEIVIPGELVEQSFLHSNSDNFEDWTKSYIKQIIKAVEGIIPKYYTGVDPFIYNVQVSLGFINPFGSTTPLGQLEYMGNIEAWTFHAPGLFRDVNPRQINR